LRIQEDRSSVADNCTKGWRCWLQQQLAGKMPDHFQIRRLRIFVVKPALDRPQIDPKDIFSQQISSNHPYPQIGAPNQ